MIKLYTVVPYCSVNLGLHTQTVNSIKGKQVTCLGKLLAHLPSQPKNSSTRVSLQFSAKFELPRSYMSLLALPNQIERERERGREREREIEIESERDRGRDR